jgi:hypothetical protein
MSVETYHPSLSPIPGVGPVRRGADRHRLAAGVLALVVAGAVGFAVYDGGSAPTVTAPAGPAAEAPAPAVVRPGDVVGRIGGGWLTYPDGVAVQVSKVAEYALPGQSANDTLYSTGVVVTVSLRNGTGKTLDAEWANVTLTYGPYDQPARPTYDRYQGQRLPGMFFAGGLAAGATDTTRFGFSVPVEYITDLTVAIRPGIKTEPAVFAGGLAAHPTPTPAPTLAPTPEDTL